MKTLSGEAVVSLIHGDGPAVEWKLPALSRGVRLKTVVGMKPLLRLLLSGFSTPWSRED